MWISGEGSEIQHKAELGSTLLQISRKVNVSAEVIQRTVMHPSPCSPQTIAGICFKNPFVVNPHPTVLTNPNGRVNPKLLMYYKALAQTEVAMVITGPATVTPPYSRRTSLLRIDQPKYLDGLRALTKILFTNGAIAGVQVAHVGDMNDPIGWLSSSKDVPSEDTEWDLGKINQVFRMACSRAEEVGFRYVELCATHGLVLHQQLALERIQWFGDLVQSCRQSFQEPILLGLRLDASLESGVSVVREFLDHGGDLFAWSGTPDSARMNELAPVLPDHFIGELWQPMSPAEVDRMLGHARLIGLPGRFPHKKNQVLSCTA